MQTHVEQPPADQREMQLMRLRHFCAGDIGLRQGFDGFVDPFLGFLSNLGFPLVDLVGQLARILGVGLQLQIRLHVADRQRVVARARTH